MVQFLCSSHLLPEESHPSCFSCMPQAAEAYCLTCSVQAHGSWSLNRRPHFLPFSREWGHHAQRPSNRSGNYSAAKTAVLDLFPSPHCWLLVCCGNGNISVMFFFFFPHAAICAFSGCVRGVLGLTFQLGRSLLSPSHHIFSLWSHHPPPLLPNFVHLGFYFLLQPCVHFPCTGHMWAP